jgi:hypothetical protein
MSSNRLDPRKLVAPKTIEIADCFPQGLAKGRFPSGARTFHPMRRILARR